MPTERVVQVAPNSTGGKIRNFGVDPGAGEVLQQAVVLVDPDVVARVLALLVTQPALGAVGIPTRPIPFRPGTPSEARITASVTEVELVAATAGRIGGVLIFNDSDADLTVKLGAGVTATSFTRKIAARGYWETPAYTGAVSGLWASAIGAANVTQLT